MILEILVETLNNLVFIKTIKINRKQSDIWLVTNEKTRTELVFQVNFKGNKYVSDFTRIFEMKKK